MLKKFKIFFILLLPLALISCGGLSLVRDELPPEYIKTDYKENTLQCIEFSKDMLKYQIDQSRLSIKEDTDMSDAEKKVFLERIKGFEKYEENRFYGAVLGNWNAYMGSRKEEPLLRSMLNIKFSIVTANNTPLIEDILQFNQKMVVTSRGQYGGYSTSIMYYYYWYIKTKLPVNAKNFKDADKPVNLIVTYPNGKTQVYSILKK